MGTRSSSRLAAMPRITSHKNWGAPRSVIVVQLIGTASTPEQGAAERPVDRHRAQNSACGAKTGLDLRTESNHLGVTGEVQENAGSSSRHASQSNAMTAAFARAALGRGGRSGRGTRASSG